MLNEATKKKIVVILFLVITVFLAYHFRVFVVASEVDIVGFENTDSIVVQEHKYVLQGQAKNSRHVYINNKEILLDTDASFAETVYLSNYQNTFYIRSISKTGPVFERHITVYKK